MSAKRVVIVGGGFAGLSAAYTLVKRGVTPVLFEAGEHVGGRGWVGTRWTWALLSSSEELRKIYYGSQKGAMRSVWPGC